MIPKASEALKAVQGIEHARNEANMKAISNAIQQGISRGDTEIRANDVRPVVKKLLEELGYSVETKHENDRGIVSRWFIISWKLPTA